MIIKFRIIFLILLISTLIGCGTISVNILGNGQYDYSQGHIYGGTKMHMQAIREEKQNALLILDIPLSIVMDTIFLPFTITGEFINSNEENETNNDKHNKIKNL